MANRARLLVKDGDISVRMARKDFLKFSAARIRDPEARIKDYGQPEEPEDVVDVTDWDTPQYLNALTEALG